jgi:hypothetical protein
MDWLRMHNPTISFRHRTMVLATAKGPTELRALSEETQPVCSSSRIELCTITAFARSLRENDTVDHASAVVAVLKHTLPALANLAGPGAEGPDIKPLSTEFSDVLVPEIPGGLPPERTAVDERPIERAIDVDQSAKPYARPPRPFSPEETQKIHKCLNDFLAKGWITPSLSPWAAPVLFVPKKLDPVTGAPGECAYPAPR